MAFQDRFLGYCVHSHPISLLAFDGLAAYMLEKSDGRWKEPVVDYLDGAGFGLFGGPIGLFIRAPLRLLTMRWPILGCSSLSRVADIYIYIYIYESTSSNQSAACS